MALIDELYSESDCQKIKSLYSSDPETRDLILKSIGSKIIEKNEKFLTTNPLDVLCLICSTANFAFSKEECLSVAVIIHKGLTYSNPLPYIIDDPGFVLAEKTLTALSFFRQAMEKRSKFRGAPSPDFYRQASVLIFKKNNHEDIAEHHLQWENFLSEMFM